ncbi:MAG: hypothetical protein LUQ07_03400 [Methanospirillum sp.]|nr:hypothetical protein [Methanospirillum sp.]
MISAGKILASCLLLLLFSLLLIEGAYADTASENNRQIYQLSNISLDPAFQKVSPGDTINLSVLLTCTGTDSGTDPAVKFQATLGPVRLISKNTSWALPEPGESKTIPLSFTIPSIQPGRYTLDISLGTEEESSVQSSAEQHIKARELIQVTSLKPGLKPRDCGCSS